MKKVIYKLGILLFAGLIVACSSIDDELGKLNIDTKNPAEVPGEPLFTNGVRNMFDQMLVVNVNLNVFRLYSQYWAQTTYPDESQYNQVTRNIPDNMWRIFYRDVLKDLDGARMIISEQETVTTEEEAVKQNKLAAISIAEVYTYSTLVDIFGNIPYTDALDAENPAPSYDDAATVYDQILVKLDDAIGAISEDQPGFSDADPVYGGDMSGWLKAANSLKLRLALRLADVNSSKSQALAEEAASNVISSNDESFTITYYPASPNTNPLWVDLVQSGRNDFIPADVLVNQMNDLADPRRAVYFTEYEGAYSGGEYGDANAASGFSQVGDLLKDPALPGTILSYSEVEFLLAEAVERGYAVGGTAEEHYNAAVTASMDEWGVSETDAAAYLEGADVAYASAAGDWKQKIGVQKWIAMYNSPFEGWTAYRLLDFSGVLINPILDGEALQVPTRFIYPIEEATLNGPEYDKAASAIGGDTKTTKIFWDVN